MSVKIDNLRVARALGWRHDGVQWVNSDMCLAQLDAPKLNDDTVCARAMVTDAIEWLYTKNWEVQNRKGLWYWHKAKTNLETLDYHSIADASREAILLELASSATKAKAPVE